MEAYAVYLIVVGLMREYLGSMSGNLADLLDRTLVVEFAIVIGLRGIQFDT